MCQSVLANEAKYVEIFCQLTMMKNILLSTTRNNLQFYSFQHIYTKVECQTVKTAYISYPSRLNLTQT